MPDTGYLIGAVVVSAAVTWGLRALPFALLARLRTSAVVTHLATVMPAGVMIILAAYCLRDLPRADRTGLLATLLGVTVTAGLHLWRRSALLSILGGTTTYILLANLLL
ncbi:AzlD domain-containing protein [Actinoplanes sichuanensis]|uniref:Branched-chain amino acid transporter permease n=1 Tax=Actinoplanes sichuanensis TaxID=512349 RepID=A0ABW4AP83_9ACTN|nr:AzlD domain-containing protein [Actinoplanes sichuanensis]BEL06650.1 AzlD domain-containing protein [Actinoplanes sichuanensis]